MILEERVIGTVVRERWTDDAGGTHYALATDGVTVVSQRAFTAVETEWMNGILAGKAAIANARTLADDGRTGIDLALSNLSSLQADLSTYAGLSASQAVSATALKGIVASLGSACVFLFRAVIRIARVSFGATDSTNVG